ncbi:MULTISPECIES: BolA family protein [Giesbergeria]|uniref:BolA family protein n=1 Tax=Giesbergeria sinuosa TaxID=80883 RepID=A0ABV9QE50_9BURK
MTPQQQPPITAAALAHSLHTALAPTTLEVLDESAAHAGHTGANATGAGSHFRVRISSPVFTNLPRVRQHRLVYDALQEWINRGVHAIAIEIL